MIKKAIAYLIEWRQRQNFKTAVRKANYLQAKTFKKHHVFLMEGKFVVIERQHLKQLHLKGKFRKGFNFRQVESLALYTTNL